ncbi:hypothetical protein BJF88_09550 [Cellulosimicrobium sp. CUA-896]|nr:hypothetical protein BJF88_09550 [Cellulosimicrobium sp. CUA-896]
MSGGRAGSRARLTTVAAALGRVLPSTPVVEVSVPPDDPAGRARAAGHLDGAVAELERVLSGLGDAGRRAVLDPLGRGDDVARTGGAAVRPLVLGGARHARWTARRAGRRSSPCSRPPATRSSRCGW